MLPVAYIYACVHAIDMWLLCVLKKNRSVDTTRGRACFLVNPLFFFKDSELLGKTSVKRKEVVYVYDSPKS